MLRKDIQLNDIIWNNINISMISNTDNITLYSTPIKMTLNEYMTIDEYKYGKTVMYKTESGMLMLIAHTEKYDSNTEHELERLFVINKEKIENLLSCELLLVCGNYLY